MWDDLLDYHLLRISGFTLLVCLSIASPTNAQGISRGTTVALVATPSRVVVGVDSYQASPGSQLSTLTCKLHRAGDVYFAPCGITVDDSVGFNLEKLCYSACSDPDTGSALFHKFETNVRDYLVLALRDIQRRIPKYYDDHISDDVSSVVFWGLRNNHLFILQRSWQVLKHSNRTFDIKMNKADFLKLDKGDLLTITAGYKDSADYLSQKIITSRSKDKVAEAVHWFLELQTRAHPDFLAGPIAIIQLDNLGRCTWLLPTKLCAGVECKQP